MFKLALKILFGWGLLVSVSASPGVEDAYRAVVDVVSPGQQELTEESLRTLFNTLENRVQCGEVPCGKVGYNRLRPAVGVRSGSRSNSELLPYLLASLRKLPQDKPVDNSVKIFKIT